MIYSRLLIAKHFLSDDGVIFISIDDHEQANLKKICDEVFGENNFVENIIWKKRYGGGAKEKYLVSLQEYVLMYCKDIDNLKEIFIPISDESAKKYYGKRDEKYNLRGGYRTHPLEAGKAMDARPNLIYPIPAPDGSLIMPKRQWLWAKERTYNALRNNELEIIRGNDGEWVVSSKQYLKDEKGNTRLGKMFSIIDNVYTQHGTNEMISILGNAKIFSYPKPTELIKILLQISTDADSIVLDFFSGSATTAHAVMELNAQDGGHRKFIMIQLPETTPENSEASRAGFKNICEIGKERIRRAGDKLKENSPEVDTGFRVFRVDSSNYLPLPSDINQLILMAENIKSDRSAEDLFFGTLLDLGMEIDLDFATENLDGFKILSYSGGEILACFEKNLPAEFFHKLARRKPKQIIFRDACFASSAAKINALEYFKIFAPDTKIKVL